MLFVFYTIKFWKSPTTPPWKKIKTLGSLKPPGAKGNDRLYTFDVGKVLHHSTLPPLLHLPKALRPSKHQVRRTTSKPGVC
jgi:hypothetical protein